MFSSWSRTQRNMRRQPVGASLNLKMVYRSPTRRSHPALAVTCRLNLGTMFLPSTHSHPDVGNHGRCSSRSVICIRSAAAFPAHAPPVALDSSMNDPMAGCGRTPTRRNDQVTFAEGLKVTALQFGRAFMALVLSMVFAAIANASDHLDSPATVANPAADIGDVYAWISPEGRQLNLVMTIQGHSFSDKVEYVFHVDSGSVFGHTSASTAIVCHFAAANSVNCKVGNLDAASGDPTNPDGLVGRNHRFRVYAALRDDPFYNNVKGLLGAYQTAATAIKNGAVVDAAGCAHFDEPTAQAILDQMDHTNGGP